MILNARWSLTLAGILVLLARVEAGRGAEDKRSNPATAAAGAEPVPQPSAVAKALASRPKIDLVETPLGCFVDSLRRDYKMNVVIDWAALGSAGIGTDTKLSARLNHATLGGALRLILPPLGLAHLVRDDVLWITTREAADKHARTVVYDVRDLLRAQGIDAVKADERDYSTLIDMVTSLVIPRTWEQVGGSGTIHPYHGTLVISQTDAVHEELAGLFGLLRRLGEPPPAGAAARESMAGILGTLVSIDLSAVPLTDAAARLSNAAGVDVWLDRAGLASGAVEIGLPVTFRGTDRPLKAALDAIVKRADAGWVCREGTIVITSAESAAQDFRIAAYDIHDLLPPEQRSLPPGDEPDYTDLIEVVTSFADPLSWDSGGGQGSLAPFRGFVVVAQGERQHAAIAAALADVRRVLRGEQPPAGDPLAGALSRRISVSLNEVPLAISLAEIGVKAGCRIQIDKPVLDANDQRHVTFNLALADVPLATILDLSLDGHGWGWYRDDDVIVVTIADKAREKVFWRSYAIVDLLPPGPAREQAGNELLETIRVSVATSSWDTVGGPGQVVLVAGQVLSVRQRERVQRQVAELLECLHAARKRGDKK